ncbi:hypothetical protein OIU85_001379 [Salix viminalis]|uniref:Peptidase M17 leucyl aminopeptidase N-terminal domain-containing protein n=1 Tax=Salix viminalis TaxID=40686 RepID=A0A9Q0ZY05_SALVM|nr:hypothetical protein OIU85_001379 [Salix viminalis]
MTKDDSKRFENSLLKNLDTNLGGHLSETSSEEDFTGKPGQSMVLRVPGHGAKRIGFIGLGKSAANAYAFRNFGDAIAAAARMRKPVMLALCLPQLEAPEMNQNLILLQRLLLGIVWGHMKITSLSQIQTNRVLKSIDILGFGNWSSTRQEAQISFEDVSSS